MCETLPVPHSETAADGDVVGHTVALPLALALVTPEADKERVGEEDTV